MSVKHVYVPYYGDVELTEEVVKTFIAKALGYGIIVSSAFVKLPQIIKLYLSKSAVGLSFIGCFMELLAVTFNTSYSLAKGYPYSSWGEAPFLQIETALIAFFILWYSEQRSQAISFVSIYALFVSVLVSGYTPVNILWYLQAMNLPLAVTGKMVQARRNLINKHTGQLSLITTFLLFFGCTARIFTSLQETGDKLIIMTFTAATLANFVLFAQVVYYWNNTNEYLRKEAKKKKS
ncbi:mannose-P-dolichol utilization defect 1-like protein [Leptotrombidium deliense]|uniref:Solute carrier family 66 member 3 n=1 Tax=Leptotrombidium deliense TaxID=299467 RepID=A0A443STG6_9ACAR|nr:mannose-P-dolichol utilization defect 1-like protein [Leptotrombidium deliense]